MSRNVYLEWHIPDLEILITPLLSFAKQKPMLGNKAPFFPLGATVNANGEMGLAMSYTGEEYPTPEITCTLLLIYAKIDMKA